MSTLFFPHFYPRDADLNVVLNLVVVCIRPRLLVVLPDHNNSSQFGDFFNHMKSDFLIKSVYHLFSVYLILVLKIC